MTVMDLINALKDCDPMKPVYCIDDNNSSFEGRFMGEYQYEPVEIYEVEGRGGTVKGKNAVMLVFR